MSRCGSTPDIPRGFGIEAAMETARYSVKYRDRGVVALGLGGGRPSFHPSRSTSRSASPSDGGLGSVPHAGEAAGVESIRGAIEVLHADRIRHGVRAVEDPGLLRELAARESSATCARCRTSAPERTPRLETHPLPAMLDGRRALLHQYRRSRDVRHRPDARVRDRGAARVRRDNGVSSRRARRAVRRDDEVSDGRGRARTTAWGARDRARDRVAEPAETVRDPAA